MLLEAMSNKSVIDLCSSSGSPSMLDRKPTFARRIEEVVVITKSGIAL